jgi:hypothetical protein
VPCPHCRSGQRQGQRTKTTLGSRTFRCVACKRRCNEHTGTPFNERSVPTASVFLVVIWRPRYTLRPRDLAELVLERRLVCSHETERSWEVLVAPFLTEHLRPDGVAERASTCFQT